jgi:hypothetical protein
MVRTDAGKNEFLWGSSALSLCSWFQDSPWTQEHGKLLPTEDDFMIRRLIGMKSEAELFDVGPFPVLLLDRVKELSINRYSHPSRA